MKWIEFVYIGKSESGKTDLWSVITKDGLGKLGVVEWYSRWRKYGFSPEQRTIFEEDCLRDIADFCEAKTKEHRAVRKAAPK